MLLTVSPLKDIGELLTTQEQEFSSSDIQFVREAVMVMVEKKVLPNNPQEGQHYVAFKNAYFPNIAPGQLIVIHQPT